MHLELRSCAEWDDAEHGCVEASLWQLMGHRVRLVAMRSRPSVPGLAARAVGNGACFTRDRWLNRTSGHLPTPEVIDASMEQAAEPPMEARGGAWHGSTGGRVEAGGLGRVYGGGTVRVLRALDLSVSTVRATTGAPGAATVIGKKPRPLRRALAFADVASLRWLCSLTVKGCTQLRTLLLPPSLTALDASTSSLAAAAIVGDGGAGGAGGAGSGALEGEGGGEGAGLLILSLGNCRELGLGAAAAAGGALACRRRPLLSRQSLSRCRELDLGWCHSLPGAAIADALRHARGLASASLRSVATDAVLSALGASEAARSGRLKLVDCAFSKQLTDAGVGALTQQARGLGRVNLRGCSKVSAACYNRTPILLLQARARDAQLSGWARPANAGDAQANSGGPGCQCGGSGSGSGFGPPPPKMPRTGGSKGDNVFFLAANLK
eukprot:g651.t1